MEEGDGLTVVYMAIWGRQLWPLPLSETPSELGGPQFSSFFSHPWHNPSMTCARPGNANSFSALDSLGSDDLCQVPPQRNFVRNGTPRDPAPHHAKLPQNADQCDLQRQHHPAHRQYGGTKPGFGGVRWSLLALGLTDAYISARHEVECRTFPEANRPLPTPPHYHPDFKNWQLSREEHHKDPVTQHRGETFLRRRSTLVESRQTMFRGYRPLSH